MGLFSSLVQAIPAIKTGMEGRNLKQQRRIGDEISNLARAQYDPSHSMYESLYARNNQAGQEDLARSVSEISRQNRKLTSMGRRPLLDQERGGESIFRNLMMGQTAVGQQARGETLNQLRSAQNALSGAYNTQDDLSQGAWQNDLTKVGSYYSIGDLLKNLFGLRQNQASQTALPSGETIHWRQ